MVLDNIVVYVYGCSGCGATRNHIRRVVKYARANRIDLTIKHSQYDKENRGEHLLRLFEAKIEVKDKIPSIIVIKNKIERLETWNL